MTLLHPAPRLALPPGLELRAAVGSSQEAILTPAALAFVAGLQRGHGKAWQALRQRRRILEAHLAEGHRLALPDPPAPPRATDFRAAEAPADLADLRVCARGPARVPFLGAALNSTAGAVLAELGDSLAPEWQQLLAAQADLCDAVRGSLSWRDPDTGDLQRLWRRPPGLALRPRPMTAVEPGLLVDGEPVIAALFDIGLFLYHNAHALHVQRRTPAVVLEGVQVRQEAAWWAAVLASAESALRLPAGTLRAMLLQDEVAGAFDLDELLWELRERIAAVVLHPAGYLRSWLAGLTARGNPLPDPRHLGPDCSMLRAWRALVVRTAHRRGVRVLGACANRLPMRGDPLANHTAMDAVRQQKRREARDGLDGALVADPELCELVREVFDEFFPPPLQHQMDLPRSHRAVTAADLLAPPRGAITLAGLRANLDLAVRYEEAALRGCGRVQIGHALYDGGDSALARAQVAQWLRLDVRLEAGTLDPETVERELARSLGRIRAAIGPQAFARGRYPQAVRNVQMALCAAVGA